MKKLGVLLGIFLMFILFLQLVSADLYDGVVAAWKFDGNASDSSPNGNDGTINGATLITTGQKLGTGAYSFDGVNDYIDTNSDMINTHFSFSVWVKRNSINTNDDVLADVKNANPHGGFLFSFRGDGNVWFRYDTGSSNDLIYYNTPDTNWHHWIGTYDGTNLKLYKDGVLVQTKTVTLNTPLSTTGLLIGTYAVESPSGVVHGIIDEVTIWNRALSPTEVTELYNSGDGLQYPFIIIQNFTITTNSNNFNVTINDTFYSTTNGTIITDINNQDLLINFTIQSEDDYINQEFINYNISNNLNIELTPLTNFTITSENLDNFTVFYTFNFYDIYNLTTTNGTIITDIYNFDKNNQSKLFYDIQIVPGYVENYYYLGGFRTLINSTLTYNGYYPIEYDPNTITTANNININFTPTYTLNSITYNNIINYSGNEYIRNLSTTLELYCDENKGANIEILINNISKKNESLLCNNNIKNYTIYYQTQQEGYQTITYNITSDIWNNETSKELIWDITNPIIESNYTLNNTFGNIINISTLCYDNITPLLLYNITFNNNKIYYGNQSNNTLINNQTTLIDGNNNFIVQCSDFFGTTITNKSIDATVKTIQLIDERTGVNFNLNSTEKVFVYFSDINYYSFTSPFVNISSINNTNLRFELEYLDAIITRYIDMSLIDDQDIRVCVSREGTTFYNQDIISATTKPALLKSSFADCYVLAYPLSFAYQDAYSVKAYTTPTLYYLYTKDQGKDVLLASFDGAQDSYVNLDTLEFSKTSYQVSLLADALAIDIDRNNNNTLIIYYQNIENENTNIRMVITDENGVVLVDTDDLDPNEFTTYFNFNSYEITDKTLFKVTLTKTKEDGTISEQSKFFDPMGKSGTIQPTFAAILAVLFLFFSLTIVIPRLSLSWLGLLFEIITLLILSFAVPVWYINFLVAINVIILVYTFFMMSQINYPTVVS